MKCVEFRELEAGKDIILAWRDGDDIYHPFHVITKKGTPRVRLTDINDKNNYIAFDEFFHTIKGYDKNGIVKELWVFDNVEECQKWCDFENEIRKL